MPNLEVYITSKRLLERTLAFAKGVIKSDPKWNVKVVPIKKFLQDGFSKDLIKGDAIATWGILRGTGVLLKEAEQRKIDYYYMDHSYFKTENKEEEWYRIVKNNHSCTSLKRVSNQRWIKYFTVNNKCMPWKNQGICGSNILICPPTHAVSWYKNLKYNWCDYIVNQLGRHPERIITWGRSLGTGPSLYLASRRKVGGLILETPFLSAFRSATGITMLPWDRFRNVDYTRGVNCPSLVIHGTLDEVVPFRQGREIFRQLPKPKKFFKVVRGKHNDLWEVGGSGYREVLKEFIRSIGS